MASLPATHTLAAGIGDVIQGVTPNWGPFAAVGGKAKILIGVIWAAALAFVVARTIWGAAMQQLGGRSYNSDTTEQGKAMFRSGLIGIAVLGSITTLATIAYGMAV